MGSCSQALFLWLFLKICSPLLSFSTVFPLSQRPSCAEVLMSDWLDGGKRRSLSTDSNKSSKVEKPRDDHETTVKVEKIKAKAIEKAEHMLKEMCFEK
jgi:hypothetical protein